MYTLHIIIFYIRLKDMCQGNISRIVETIVIKKKLKVTPLKFEVKIWIIYIRIQNGVNI